MLKKLIKKLVPASALSLYHLAWAWCAAAFYGFPSRKLTVIGITGTNGKSSTVWILARMLEQSGIKTAASSSIEFQIGDRCFENKYKMTMPGRGRVQKFLHDAVKAGCTHAVIEVTSEGIVQHRHRFIDFDVAAFLNLAPEHIERHGSYENYREAKGELFRYLKPEGTAVINIADKEAPWFLRHVHDGERVIGFRLDSAKPQAKLPPGAAEVVAQNMHVGPHGVRFTFDETRFASPLKGTTNVENLLCAAAIAKEVGVSLPDAAAVAETLSDIPGRLQEIENTEGIRVVVDYAHTPSALERVYQTVHNDAKQMICVLGAAGGGRDKWKRPKLGALAGRFCDVAYVADEDPYDEDPAAIRHEVLEGIKQGGRARREEIPDRKKAIETAITQASPGDAVVITGKGSEPWMVVAGGKKVPWDDRKLAKDALASRSDGARN